MTTPARNAEADEVERAFQIALASIGAATVADALVLWDAVPPNAKASTVSSWLSKAIDLVMTRRGASRDLGLAYYRLVRALRTGTTIPSPLDEERTSVTLGELREQFIGLAGSESPVEPTPSSPTRETTEGPTGPESTPYDPSEDDELDAILIEELEQLDRDEAAELAAAEEEARIALEALGPKNQQSKVDELDDTEPAQDVDKKRTSVHDQAGARQAAAASRVAMDGARSGIWDIAQRDKRAIGYVRLSRTGTPCGFCAMLISRGPVYKSEESATYKGAAGYNDGDLYHDNCNCYAMPIFGPSQYDDSDLYALNKEYAEQWPRVTRGLSGKAALSAWRRFIRSQSKTRAQAAAANN